jgi:DNA-binding transcriptional MerR regulator
MDSKSYDIQKLVHASGIPRRTIYFYVQQGILPPPQGAGLAAYYSEDHILRLRLIPLLRQQGLRLDEIRERFANMSEDEMRKALDNSPVRTTQVQQRSIRELPELPGWRAAQRYTHHQLPAGISLVVPDALAAADQQRVQLLLQAARQIFSGPYAVDVTLGTADSRNSQASSGNGEVDLPAEEE